MIRELRNFLFKGNVLDLAVAVVMGTAFNAIVTSLVSDIITPLILNPVVKAANVENLSKLSWNGIAYGSFLSAVITTSSSLVLLSSSLLKLLVKQQLLVKNKLKKLLKKLVHHKKNCLLKSATFLQTNNLYLFN